MTQVASQNRAMTILDGMNVKPAEVVDGSDISMKERRNQLFDVSGIRGKYPQFFLINSKGEKEDGGGNDSITSLGDFETFEWLNDEGTLLQTIVG